MPLKSYLAETAGDSPQKVLVTQRIPECGILVMTKAGYQVDVWEEAQLNHEELLQRCKDYTGIVTMLSDPIDEEFLESNKQLKVITNYAVGFNNIDIATAKRLAIRVGNTPDVLTDATAELCVSLICATARNLMPANRDVHGGNWTQWEPMGYHGMQLRGKTLGIVGLGRIGLRVAEIMNKGFGMGIAFTSRSEKIEISAKYGFKQVAFRDLLAVSDVVSVHCPLTPDTQGLFDFEAFKKMKKQSLFINTARGSIHNQNDLYKALVDGYIAGCGLDVTDPEPIPLIDPLLTLSNAVILPHIGSATYEAREAMSIICAENVIRGLEEKTLLHPVY